MSQINELMEKKAVKKRADWTDLNQDGKRLDKIIKSMNTRIFNNSRRKNKPEPLSEEHYISYVNTIIRLTHEKRAIVDTVLGVNQLLKDMKVR